MRKRNGPEGPPSHSEIETETPKSVADGKEPKSERFAAIPYRTYEAFEEYHLDRDDHFILGWIIAHTNPHNGKYVRHLSRLKEDLRFERSDDTLRRKLKKLREDGWIEYAAPHAGSHKPYVFHLSGAALKSWQEGITTSAPPPHHLRKTPPPDAEVT